MAQQHLGDRTLVRVHAPQELVAIIAQTAASQGLPVSRVASDLLSSVIGREDLLLSDSPPLIRTPTTAAPEPASSTGILQFRAPTEVIHEVEERGRQLELDRPAIVRSLLSEALGLDHLVEHRADGRQLMMTG